MTYCQGCIYDQYKGRDDVKSCTHPNFGKLAFYHAPMSHCYTTEDQTVRAILELVRIVNGERARVCK